MKNEEYAVIQPWFDYIVDWSGLEFTVDAFAPAKQHLLPRFWDPVKDAFCQDWSQDVLWMNPPFSLLEEVLDKIVREGAQGVLVVPVWTSLPWFDILGMIAVHWFNVPHDTCFYAGVEGYLCDRPDGTPELYCSMLLVSWII